MEISFDALHNVIEDRALHHFNNNKPDMRRIYSSPYDNKVVSLVFNDVNDCLLNKYTTSVITVDQTFEFERSKFLSIYMEKGNVSAIKSRGIYTIAVEIKSLNYTRYVHLDV